MTVPLLPEWLMFATFMGAAIAKLRSGHWEHALTRFTLALFYLYVAMPEVSLETARIYSRWFLWVMVFVEIVSYVTFKTSKRLRK